jgi:uncharacterized protein YjcR
MVDARYKDRDWLHGKYIDEGWSTTDIGKLCGVTHKTICRWLDKYGIPTRDAQACQLTLSKQLKREAARRSVRDYIQGQQESIQNVEGNKPTLKWR